MKVYILQKISNGEIISVYHSKVKARFIQKVMNREGKKVAMLECEVK